MARDTSPSPVLFANRCELLNNIIQTYIPQLFEQPVVDSEFEKANGEANQENANLKTSPNEEGTEPQEKVPIRTTRPAQEEHYNE